MKPLIMKFGGTSVGNPQAIRRSAEIVRAVCEGRVGEGNALAYPPAYPSAYPPPSLPPCVVVSAMRGVTDLLLESAAAAANGDTHAVDEALEKLAGQHYAALAELAPSGEGRQAVGARLAEFEALGRAIGVLGEASPRALDAVAALGERLNAPVVAAAFNALGLPARAVDAAELIVTDAVFGAASPDMAATRERAVAVLGPPLAPGVIPVVTGFIGATPQGQVTTLGRGGSDFSAAILGVALEAAEVWIYTDVDGVMSADPRVVPEARTLPAVTFREISELAYYGAKVLHPRTIRPVVERGIALRVKNTFNPGGPGTLIAPDNGASPGAIRAVTAIRAQKLIAIEGTGMLGVPGVAARAFAAVARTRASVVMISQASSEQSICFAIPAAQAGGAAAALQEEFRRELERRDIDSIRQSEEIVIVTAVGAGMRSTPGVAGRIFGALGEAGINVIAIAQGSSECSISLAVAAPDADRAVRAIHARMDKW